MNDELSAFAARLPLIAKTRVAGVVRACLELGRDDSALTESVTQLALLICAFDDLLDAPAIRLPDGSALLNDVAAAMRGQASNPVRLAVSWPRHRDELVRLGTLLSARSPRLAAGFFEAFDAMLHAMRRELSWRSGPRPSFDEYRQVGCRSIAAPAVAHWVASWQGLAVDARGEALMTEIGLALRLGNDLADRGREAGEGKLNALDLIQHERGVTPDDARAFLEAALLEHVTQAKRLVCDAWGEAALAFTEFLLSGYAREGDLALKHDRQD